MPFLPMSLTSKLDVEITFHTLGRTLLLDKLKKKKKCEWAYRLKVEGQEFSQSKKQKKANKC